jgi:hypothetical protein
MSLDSHQSHGFGDTGLSYIKSPVCHCDFNIGKVLGGLMKSNYNGYEYFIFTKTNLEQKGAEIVMNEDVSYFSFMGQVDFFKHKKSDPEGSQLIPRTPIFRKN